MVTLILLREMLEINICFFLFQVGFDSKPGGTNSFPNQLISLSQIRNYAHQPDMLHSLKEKVTQ